MSILFSYKTIFHPKTNNFNIFRYIISNFTSSTPFNKTIFTDVPPRNSPPLLLWDQYAPAIERKEMEDEKYFIPLSSIRNRSSHPVVNSLPLSDNEMNLRIKTFSSMCRCYENTAVELLEKNPRLQLYPPHLIIKRFNKLQKLFLLTKPQVSRLCLHSPTLLYLLEDLIIQRYNDLKKLFPTSDKAQFIEILMRYPYAFNFHVSIDDLQNQIVKLSKLISLSYQDTLSLYINYAKLFTIPSSHIVSTFSYLMHEVGFSSNLSQLQKHSYLLASSLDRLNNNFTFLSSLFSSSDIVDCPFGLRRSHYRCVRARYNYSQHINRKFSLDWLDLSDIKFCKNTIQIPYNDYSYYLLWYKETLKEHNTNIYQ